MGEGQGGAATLARPQARRQVASAFAQAAWISAIPCTLVVAAAIALLAEPLGTVLSPGSHFVFLLGARPFVHPEPTEHASYLLALVGPLLWAAAIASSPRWRARVPSDLAGWAILTTELLAAAVVVVCLIRQNTLQYGLIYTEGQGGGILTVHYFKPATIVAAAALAAMAPFVVRGIDARRVAGLLRETRARRVGIALAAIAVTAIWVLPALQTDRSVGAAQTDVLYHLGFTFDETFAVLNGRTPLVDFTAQYSNLWPYLTALSLLLFGKTLLAFTITLSALTGLALLAVFSVLRRTVRSSLAALLLYLPFLASSLFILGGTSANRSTVGSYFGNFPLRYVGPYLLAWITARQLERRSPVGLLALFLAAGVVLLNNADFGVPALAASIAALAWTMPIFTVRRAIRLMLVVAIGLAGALALVSLLTLVQAGALPQLERLVAFARVYSVGGYAMMPLPGIIGLHLLVYLTYAVAIGVATVRALRGASNRVLTGMLAWTGVFGLASAGYYVGRSHPVSLITTFSVWSLALALLLVVVIPLLRVERSPQTILPATLVMFGFGLVACSLAQLPLPWTQLQRLNAPFSVTEQVPFAEPLVPPRSAATRRFVTSLADGPSRFVERPGAPVAIMLTTGHRIADAYGVVNVSPYTGAESLHTLDEVDSVIDALRSAGGNTMILPLRVSLGVEEALERRGFRIVTRHGLAMPEPNRTDVILMPWKGDDDVLANPGTIMKWVDTRHLHPRALE
jgi:hypothetical protein